MTQEDTPFRTQHHTRIRTQQINQNMTQEDTPFRTKRAVKTRHNRTKQNTTAGTPSAGVSPIRKSSVHCTVHTALYIVYNSHCTVQHAVQLSSLCSLHTPMYSTVYSAVHTVHTPMYSNELARGGSVAKGSNF